MNGGVFQRALEFTRWPSCDKAVNESLNIAVVVMDGTQFPANWNKDGLAALTLNCSLFHQPLRLKLWWNRSWVGPLIKIQDLSAGLVIVDEELSTCVVCVGSSSGSMDFSWKRTKTSFLKCRQSTDSGVVTKIQCDLDPDWNRIHLDRSLNSCCAVICVHIFSG